MKRHRCGNDPSTASLVTDRRGATLVEFAIVAPALIALLMAVVEAGIVYFSEAALETAALDSIRSIATGTVQKTKMSRAALTERACRRLPAHMPCDRLSLEVISAPKLSDFAALPYELTTATSAIPASPAFAPGGPGDIVVLRLFYRWPAIAGPMGFNLANMASGERLLIATQIAKAEPYPA